MMNRKFTLLALSLGIATLPVHAEETPDYTLTANVGLVSNYFFRGITQTWGGSAIQASAQVNHNSGLFVGVFFSNVSGNQYAGGNLEWDLFGGYLFKINDDLALNVGFIRYGYPGANYNNVFNDAPSQTYNTLEGNAGITWKYLEAKISYVVSDYFGANQDTGFKGSTNGTYYPELNATVPVYDTFSLVGHMGYTNYAAKLDNNNPGVKNDPNYADWKLGVNYVYDTWTFGAYYVGGTNKDFYKDVPSVANSSHRDLLVNGGYLSVNKVF